MQVEKAQLSSDVIKWTLHTHENDVKIYRGHDPHSHLSLFMGITHVRGELHDIAAVLDVPRLDKGVQQTRTLHSVAAPSEESDDHESVRVVWHSFKSPVPMFVNKRDACLLEVRSVSPFLISYQISVST